MRSGVFVGIRHEFTTPVPLVTGKELGACNGFGGYPSERPGWVSFLLTAVHFCGFFSLILVTTTRFGAFSEVPTANWGYPQRILM